MLNWGESGELIYLIECRMMIDETQVGVIHILLNDSKKYVLKSNISIMIFVVSESKRSEI